MEIKRKLKWPLLLFILLFLLIIIPVEAVDPYVCYTDEFRIDWCSGYDGERETTAYSIPHFYFDEESGWQEINTNLMSYSGYTYEFYNDRGLYEAYFDETGDQVLFKEKQSGYELSLVEQYMKYVNGTDEYDYGTPSHTGFRDKDTFIYKNAWGNHNITYQYLPSMLKQRFMLNSLPDANLEGSDINLTFRTKISPTSVLDIYVNEKKWDGSEIVTNNRITFKDEEVIVYFFPANPPIIDADGNIYTAEYKMSKAGENIFVTLIVPYNVLKNMKFPVEVDPTTTLAVAQGLIYEDTRTREGGGHGGDNYVTGSEFDPGCVDATDCRRGYLVIDFSSLVPTTITMANLMLRGSGAASCPGDGYGIDYDYCNVEANMSNMTWNNQDTEVPSCTTRHNAENFCSLSSGIYNGNEYSNYSFTSDASSEIGDDMLFTVRVKPDDETGATASIWAWATKDYAGTDRDPYFNMTYSVSISIDNQTTTPTTPLFGSFVFPEVGVGGDNESISCNFTYALPDSGTRMSMVNGSTTDKKMWNISQGQTVNESGTHKWNATCYDSALSSDTSDNYFTIVDDVNITPSSFSDSTSANANSSVQINITQGNNATDFNVTYEGLNASCPDLNFNYSTMLIPESGFNDSNKILINTTGASAGLCEYNITITRIFDNYEFTKIPINITISSTAPNIEHVNTSTWTVSMTTTDTETHLYSVNNTGAGDTLNNCVPSLTSSITGSSFNATGWTMTQNVTYNFLLTIANPTAGSYSPKVRVSCTEDSTSSATEPDIILTVTGSTTPSTSTGGGGGGGGVECPLKIVSPIGDILMFGRPGATTDWQQIKIENTGDAERTFTFSFNQSSLKEACEFEVNSKAVAGGSTFVNRVKCDLPKEEEFEEFKGEVRVGVLGMDCSKTIPLLISTNVWGYIGNQIYNFFASPTGLLVLLVLGLMAALILGVIANNIKKRRRRR